MLVDCLETKLTAEFNIASDNVYIVCNPRQCHQQAILRNREAEHALKQSDVSHLHQMHEVFCQGQIKVPNSTPADIEDIVNIIVSL